MLTVWNSLGDYVWDPAISALYTVGIYLKRFVAQY